ncbi:MAG: ABC transporter permease subunit [Anaerolineae bacterium]|nr:ABC transporter permease subunit [Anaerolineae bacterium]
MSVQTTTTLNTLVERIRLRRDRLTAILMLSPSVILLAIFVYGFIGQTAWASLTDWQGLSANPVINFIGLENYNQLFTGLLDVRFRQDLVNTFFFTVFFLVGCLGMGILLAILLDQNIKGETIFRTIFLFPMALSFIVTGTIWRWLYNPGGGINRLPTLIGLPALEWGWLTDRTQIWRFNWQDLPAIFALVIAAVLAWLAYRYWRDKRRQAAVISGGIAALILIWVLMGGAASVQTVPFPEQHGFNVAFIGIILAAVWQMSGYTMAMYLAGLRGIPEELREAARVDGASELQTYLYVVFPLLKPITLSAMIVLGHISLKIFDLIFAMAGADNATTDVPGILMYLTSFRANQFAKGAAIAIVMLVMVAVVIVPYLWTTLRSEHEL